MDDIPTMDMVSCPTCSSAPGVVFDRPTGRAVRFCVPCRREVNLSSPSHPSLPHDFDPPPLPHDSSPAPQPSATPPPTRNWFTHGPLSTFSPLYEWGSAPPTNPGSGSQSWLFCPLISLWLALSESQLGVPPYSTGSRDQVPFDQSLSFGPPTPTPSSRRSSLTSVPLIVTNLLPGCCNRGSAATYLHLLTHCVHADGVVV